MCSTSSMPTSAYVPILQPSMASKHGRHACTHMLVDCVLCVYIGVPACHSTATTPPHIPYNNNVLHGNAVMPTGANARQSGVGLAVPGVFHDAQDLHATPPTTCIGTGSSSIMQGGDAPAGAPGRWCQTRRLLPSDVMHTLLHGTWATRSTQAAGSSVSCSGSLLINHSPKPSKQSARPSSWKQPVIWTVASVDTAAATAGGNRTAAALNHTKPQKPMAAPSKGKCCTKQYVSREAEQR